MKTIKEIRDNYAIQQGYESWDIMYLNYIRTSDDKLIHHLNKVIDLVQDELKNKICETALIRHDFNLMSDTSSGESQKRFKGNGADFYEIDINSILNTENIK